MRLAPTLLLLGGLSSLACSPAPPADTPHATPSAPTATTAATAAPTSTAQAGPTPPIAARIPVTTKIHGRELVDDYAWLKNRDSKEVLAHLAAENAYTDAMTKPLAPLEEELYREMVSRVAEDDVSVPYEKGNYLYYQRLEKGKQYPIRCRKPRSGKGDEQVILDPNEIGKTEKFVGISATEVSDDGNYLAYGLDTVGYRQFVLQIKDLRTGAVLPDRAERVVSFTFAADNKTLLYSQEDATTKRSYLIKRHVISTAKGAPKDGADPVVFEEKNDRYGAYVGRTSSGAYLTIGSYSMRSSEEQLIPAAKPDSPPRLIAPREEGREYYVDHRGSDLYIRENGGGPNFRLVKAKVDKPDRSSWREVLPHDDAVLLDTFKVMKDFTVVVTRKNGQRAVRVLDTKDRVQTDSIPLPDAVREVRLGDNDRFDAPFVRIEYESPVTPPSTYDYEVSKKALTLKKRTAIPNYDPANYQVERAEATSPDGTKVPLSLLARKGVTPDGKHPALLYGYGSYGFALRTTFSADRLSLVDRGFVYAFAHVRGGTDLGEKWHEDGRFAKKKNSFADFIASAEYLVSTGWAERRRIVSEGRSAGGLLVAGAMVKRPDLWGGVLAGVPFVDVINTELDTSLPLTTGDYEEFGDPRDPKIFEAMLGYSPYDNIAAADYPPVLVTSSYHDSQVMYWEPAKFVAKLRAKRANDAPLYLRMDMDPSGHGGKSGRYEKLREAAFRYAFAIEVTKRK